MNGCSRHAHFALRVTAVGALLAVVAAFPVVQGQAPGSLTPRPGQGESPNPAVAQKPPGLLIPMSGIKPTLKSERVLESPSGEVSKVAFSPDGKTVVSGSWVDDTAVIFWDAETAARIRTKTVMVLDTRGLIAFALMKDVERIFRKDEFETTAEYQARVGDRTVPLDVPLALGTYDADKGAFEAELAGVKMAVTVPREMARGLVGAEDGAPLRRHVAIP